MRPVRIATRGSELALAQSRAVAAAIRERLGRPTELVVVTTSGDRIQDRPLASIGGKGLFVKEIQEALLENRADLAVHSAKDLPARTPFELELVAFPPREDPRDALLTRPRGGSLEALPPGARVGTGSTRRTAQLRALRPDLEVVPLRGNVPTRIRRLEEGELDAVVLACAGLARLGLAERIDQRISTSQLLPAVGQGTLALEARRGDALGRELRVLADPDSTTAARAERAFQARLGGDCTVPLACLAEPGPSGWLRLRGFVGSPDGSRAVRAEAEAPPEDAERAGRELAEEVLARGGEAVLRDLRSGAPA